MHGLKEPPAPVCHLPDNADDVCKVEPTGHVLPTDVATPTTLGVSTSGTIHDASGLSGSERVHVKRPLLIPAQPFRISDDRGLNKASNCHDQVMAYATMTCVVLPAVSRLGCDNGCKKISNCHNQVMAAATSTCEVVTATCEVISVVLGLDCSDGRNKDANYHDPVLVTAMATCEVIPAILGSGSMSGVTLMKGVGQTLEDVCMVDVTQSGGLLQEAHLCVARASGGEKGSDNLATGMVQTWVVS
ncbi:hypothetical protein FH972_005335 [Carpinus fangiana]|uniref:Uncharacterized protein n=1 Tax=Carpinus fangiana TaxID=176857 RepID=A0A5N6QPB5_9ROSI|nr:hypothetical protein FH972_005335 [Carpinus fangiana]